MMEPDKVDLVFEGGGVKGIALVGAVEYLETMGMKPQNVVGTSAGAIVAALVAAGYSARDIRGIMEGLDYRRFRDMSRLERLPLIGPALSLLREKGLYEGAYLESWLRKLLAESPRQVHTFKDLHLEDEKGSEVDPKYRYRLQVIATDLSRRKQLVLPRDIQDYGWDPEQLDVAWAVRMSMSIPLFFEPVRLENGQGLTSFVVDGGVLSNFPVDILDDGSAQPAWPTFGLKLVERTRADGREEVMPCRIQGPLSLLEAVISTMLEAHDARYIEQKNFDRTIAIPTLGVKTTDFDLGREQVHALYEAGYAAAARFFETWDFQAWVRKYRQSEPPRQETASESARENITALLASG
jgi:NTE family protein